MGCRIGEGGRFWQLSGGALWDWDLSGMGKQLSLRKSTGDRRKSRVRKGTERAWFPLSLGLGSRSESSEERVQVGLPNKMSDAELNLSFS